MAVLTIEHVNRTPLENPLGVLEKLGAPPIEFEVVNIQPQPARRAPDFNMINGRIDARAVTLRDFISFAYDRRRRLGEGRSKVDRPRPIPPIRLGYLNCRSPRRPRVGASTSSRAGLGVEIVRWLTRSIDLLYSDFYSDGHLRARITELGEFYA
jgi:hypothetical protein